MTTGHLPSLAWSPTNPRMVTLHKEVTNAMDCHLLSHGWSPNIPRMVTHQKEVYYRLQIWQLHFTLKTITRWQLPCMVTYHSLGGRPQTLGWSPTRRKCTSNLEFGNYTLLTKLTPGDNCHEWSPTILRMVTHQPKDGHPSEGSALQTWNLVLRPNFQKWSPTIPNSQN